MSRMQPLDRNAVPLGHLTQELGQAGDVSR
jgi:hypothetical protein